MLKIIVLHYNIAIFYYIQIIILIKKKVPRPNLQAYEKEDSIETKFIKSTRFIYITTSN